MVTIDDIRALMAGTGVRTTNKKVLQVFVDVLQAGEQPHGFGLFEKMWISGAQIKGNFPTLYLTDQRLIAVQNDPTLRLSFQPNLNLFPFALSEVVGIGSNGQAYDIGFRNGDRLTVKRLMFRKDRTSKFLHELENRVPPSAITGTA